MFKLLVMFFLICVSLLAQTIELKNINTSNYPKIRVEVDAFNASNQQYRGLATDDVKIKENGVSRTVTDKFCEQDAVKFSLIISVDLSGTMALGLGNNDVQVKPNRRYDAILRSVELLVQNLDFENTEVALLATAGIGTVHLGFSQNKDSILKAIKSFPELVNSTEINVAFIGKNQYGSPKGIGSLNQAEKAKCKPVVMFFSDGGQFTYDQPPILSEIKEDWILDKANEVGAIIYNLNFGTYSNSKLASISASTGGDVFESSDLATEDEIQGVIETIINQVKLNPQALAPCEVEFLTDCSGGGTLEVTAVINGVSATATATYTIPDEIKPNLDIDIRTPYFNNVAASTYRDFPVTLTAKNNDVTITDFITNDPRFTINGSYKGKIAKNTSKNVVIRFTSNGSSTCTQFDFSFVSDACSGNDMHPYVGSSEAVDVNVGSAVLGSSVTNNRLAFQNNLCIDIELKGISFGDAAFTSNAVFPKVVPAGQKVNFDFTYTPTKTGTVSSTFRLDAGEDGKFTANIVGGGSGQAQITTSAPNQPLVKCTNTDEISFEIENTGEVAMDVSSVSVDNTTDFTLTTPTNFSIPTGDKAVVKLTFHPSTEGVKNANVTIENNSSNEPTKVVAISGKRNNISAQADGVYDIGVICPNSDYNFTIPITNNGEVATNVTLSTNNTDITFPSGANLALATVGSATNATIKVNSANIGAFSADLVVTDECGEQQVVIKVSGEVREASVDYADISKVKLNSNLNEKITQIIEIKNNDSRAINNVVVSVVGNPGYFTIQPGYPTTISGNGSINVSVDYLPTVQGSSNFDLLVTGDVGGKACLSTQLPRVVAGTNLAEATWSTGDYTGLIGQTITLNLAKLVDVNGFSTSGVTAVNFEIEVDSRLLQSADGLPESITGFTRTIDYVYDVSNPKPINLLVLDPNDISINSSQITISNASTVPVGRAIVNRNDGNFTLIRANGKVEVGDNKGKVGDAVTILISSQNLVNVDANFHKKINGELRVNASVLAPRGKTPAGRIVTEMGSVYRYVPFSLNLLAGNPKVSEIQAVSDQAKLEFYATLGDAESTEMELVNLSSEVGKIDLDTLNIGTFLITDVCKNDNGQILLLWKSNPTAPIVIKGENPINGTTEFTLNSLESGNYIITVSDANGNIIKTIYNGYLVKGEKNFYLDPSNLAQGSYYINVITPSERFDKNFMYVK